jgi:putative solute:sodium symporter small subunit
MEDARRQRFWRHTLWLTAALLLLWLLVCLALPWFARDLDGRRGFDFPLGYWLVAEGSLLLFVFIVVAYAWGMERLEARWRATEPPGAPQ